jgi:hypothetical protein
MHFLAPPAGLLSADNHPPHTLGFTFARTIITAADGADPVLAVDIAAQVPALQALIGAAGNAS